MRRLISLVSAISLLTSSTSTIVACGPGPGAKVEIEFKNPPQKQTIDTDPQKDYVYNDYYKYDLNTLYTPLAAFMQLAADKIKIDKNTLNVTSVANDFYNSNAYRSDSYESINYNNYDDAHKLKRPFSTTDKNGTPLIFGLTDNDKTKQQSFGYWFVTYDNANAAENPKPDDKTSIVVPKFREFRDNKKQKITKQGWIHLFLTMHDVKTNKNFKIDFNIQIDVSFILYVDTNKQEIIVVDKSTVEKALGDIDFYHPESSFNRINDMTFSET